MHVIFALICTSCIDAKQIKLLHTSALRKSERERGGLIEQFPMKLRIPLQKHDMRDNYIRAMDKGLNRASINIYKDLFSQTKWNEKLQQQDRE